MVQYFCHLTWLVSSESWADSAKIGIKMTKFHIELRKNATIRHIWHYHQRTPNYPRKVGTIVVFAASSRNLSISGPFYGHIFHKYCQFEHYVSQFFSSSSFMSTEKPFLGAEMISEPPNWPFKCQNRIEIDWFRPYCVPWYRSMLNYAIIPYRLYWNNNRA